MKRCSVILLLFLLATIATVAQETYLNTTLRKQSWSDLPVIYVNEAKGGLQTLEMELNGLTPAEITNSLNGVILPNFREDGMVVVNTDASGNARFFQLLAPDVWREVYIITSWLPGVTYIPGQPILHNGNLFIAKDTISGVEPLVGADWKDSWANLGGLDSTDLDFALKNLSNLEDVAINQDLTPGKTDTLDLGSAIARWNSLYLSDALYLGQDTALDIAEIQDWSEADTLNGTTLSSVGYTHKAIKEGGNEIGFQYGGKKVTRAGWAGVTGTSVNTDNIEEFLKKIFFPVSSPMITALKYDTEANVANFSFETEDPVSNLIVESVGTDAIAYAAWDAGGNIPVNYTIKNRSVRAADESEDTPIDSVALYINNVRVGMNVVGNLNEDIAGSFTVAYSDLATNPTVAQSNAVLLKVYDPYPNYNDLLLNLNMAAALQSRVDWCHFFDQVSGISYTGGTLPPGTEGAGTVADPYLIQRTGADIPLIIRTQVDALDETISRIAYTANGFTAPGDETVNITTDNVQYSINQAIPNDELDPLRVGSQVEGNVYNALSTPVNYSSYIQLADKSYAGFLASDVLPLEVQVEALQDGRLKNTGFYEPVNGVTLSNTTGGSGFFTWAIPTYVDGAQPAPVAFATPTTYYEAAGTWQVNTNVNTYFVNLIPSGGGNGSWYWVCIYKASVANNGNIKVKLSN